MPSHCYLNGEFVPLDEARISIRTHALHYGTGCFEGIRGYWNDAERQLYVLHLREHFARFHRSARILFIRLPLSADELSEVTVELLRRNGDEHDVYIRPLAYKDGQEIGPRLHDVHDGLAIFAIPLGKYLATDKGIRCCTSTWRRVDDNGIPARAKVTGLYVNSALARTE
ncbi:MAG: aminotransferase class IV, partial [Chloroflexi bacterium]|nr:aminotransferase class IV [Chloroflexota bacterium]